MGSLKSRRSRVGVRGDKSVPYRGDGDMADSEENYEVEESHKYSAGSPPPDKLFSLTREKRHQHDFPIFTSIPVFSKVNSPTNLVLQVSCQFLGHGCSAVANKSLRTVFIFFTTPSIFHSCKSLLNTCKAKIRQ